MRSVTAAVLSALANTLLALTPSHADGSRIYVREPRILLSPAQTKLYHACLTDGWVEEFCRDHGWGIFGTYEQTKAECIAAEHHGRYIVNGRPPFLSTEAYCWAKAHKLAP